MLAVGIAFAAYQAWVWPDRVRPRQLVVLAPEGMAVSVIDGPEPLDSTRGVNAWMVNPGPMTLLIQHSDGPTEETPITIPKGLGTLMLDIQFDENGILQIGYF